MNYHDTMNGEAPTFVALSVFLLMLAFYAVRSWKRPRALTQPQPMDYDLQRALHAFKTSTLTTRTSHLGTETLEKLWRIQNPFVSTSYSLQRRYREALLRQFARTDWAAVARTTAAALQPYLRREEGHGHAPYLAIALRDASRDVTLAAVLQGLFGIDNVDHATLVYIGTEIHDLTVAKKVFDASATSAADLPQALQERSDQLIVTLRQIFSSVKSTSFLAQTLLCASFDDDYKGEKEESNPLNLVIPAFEAPWRAIFYTLLATLQQSPAHCNDVLTLRDSSPRSLPSNAAIAIAHESLRLYPPIRRVRRDYQVDVERLQRDEKYWGPSALEFKASRFLNDDGHGDGRVTPPSAWLPFAAGSMKCPSAYGYSARLMVTIVGEMLRQFFPVGTQPSWRLEGDEWDEAAQRGEVLRAGRDEYSGVRLHVDLTR